MNKSIFGLPPVQLVSFPFARRSGFWLPTALCVAQLAPLLSLGFIAGCGGGSKPQAVSLADSGRTGRAVFSVQWPTPTGKLVPSSANSIRVNIYRADGSEVAPPGIIGRDKSSVSFNGLPVGDYMVNAAAYPNADGSGTAQSQGMARLSIQASATTTIELEMNTTVAQVAVRGDGNPLSGDTVHYWAEAKDANGKVVLTDPGRMAWRVSNADKLKINAPSGLQAEAYCNSPSDVTLFAKDTETGVESGAYRVAIKERTGGIFRKGGLPGEDRHDVSGKVATDGNYVYLLQAINESGRAPIGFSPGEPCVVTAWNECPPNSAYDLPPTVNRYQIARYAVDRTTPEPSMTPDALVDIGSIVKARFTKRAIENTDFAYECGENAVFHGLAADASGSLYFGVQSGGTNRLVKGKLVDVGGSINNGLDYTTNASFAEDTVFAPDANGVKNVRDVRLFSDNLYVLTDTKLLVLNKTTGAQISLRALPTGPEYRALAVGESGEPFLLIKDALTSKLVKLTSTGALGLLKSDFGDARDIAVLPNNVLAVAGDASITFLSGDGTVITPSLTIAAKSTPKKPLSLGVDGAGWLYVLDDTSVSDISTVQEDGFLSASYSVFRLNR